MHLLSTLPSLLVLLGHCTPGDADRGRDVERGTGSAVARHLAESLLAPRIEPMTRSTAQDDSAVTRIIDRYVGLSGDAARAARGQMVCGQAARSLALQHSRDDDDALRSESAVVPLSLMAGDLETEAAPDSSPVT